MAYSNEHEIKEHSYRKELIRLIEVEKDGEFHTMKEYIVDLKVSLTGVKEYWTNDNSDIICSESLKDSLFILANNFGLKCPENFGTLCCKHFLSQYSHIEKVSLFIEDFAWNRISYDGINFHNHAFIHKPDCKRTSTVTMNRKDTKPIVESGVKDLHVVKTTKATLIGSYNDEYKTAPEIFDRVLSTKMSFTWKYKEQLVDIDYDKVWERAKNAALQDWAGDVKLGAYKSSTQYSAQTAQKSILDAVPEILSIKMNLPNLIYTDFDLERFPKHLVLKNESRNIMMASLPSFISCEMVRK